MPLAYIVRQKAIAFAATMSIFLFHADIAAIHGDIIYCGCSRGTATGWMIRSSTLVGWILKTFDLEEATDESLMAIPRGRLEHKSLRR